MLPIAVLALPLLTAAAVLLTRDRRVRAWLWVFGSAVSLALAAVQAARVVAGGPISALGGELLVDGLAALMASLVGFLIFSLLSNI